jgi:hypothetical protein
MCVCVGGGGGGDTHNRPKIKVFSWLHSIHSKNTSTAVLRRRFTWMDPTISGKKGGRNFYYWSIL